MSDRRAPGELEAEVLGALWAADRPLTPADVRDQVPGELAYTTILTILRRLFDKNLVVRHPTAGSRAFAYAPAIDQAEHAATQMHAFLEQGSDRQAVLARFLGRLSPDEQTALRNLLRTGRGGR